MVREGPKEYNSTSTKTALLSRELTLLPVACFTRSLSIDVLGVHGRCRRGCMRLHEATAAARRRSTNRNKWKEDRVVRCLMVVLHSIGINQVYRMSKDGARIALRWFADYRECSLAVHSSIT